MQTTTKDQRASRRFRHKCHLVCSLIHQEDCYTVIKKDHSKGGLSFRSRLEFRPGTVLCIRNNACEIQSLTPEAWEGVRSISLAEVRWCHEEKELGNIFFDIGVQYKDMAL